mgnify:CR=1 FL=1
MQINDMVENAYRNACDKGWHDSERSFGELIALCHSELSEALEDYRHGYKPTDVYYTRRNYDDANKPCGIPSELADVVIRIADMCGQYGIDLDKAITEKMEYNKTRSYKHNGKVI